MIWHRVMFSLAGLIGAPTSVLDRLGRLARGLGAEVHLFDCLYDPDAEAVRPPGTTLDAIIRQRVEQRRRQAQLLADALRAQALKVHVSVHWDFPVHEAIVRHVLRHEPDLLIVPTTRASESEQRFLTYTDHRLIETCPCPLLLLKTRQGYAPGTVVAAVDPMHGYDRSGELDETILGAANTMARALGDAAVHACHFVAPGAPQGIEAHCADDAVRLESAAQRVRAMAALHDVPDSHVHVEFGAVASALPLLARALRAQVLIMGAASRSLPQRAVLALTAEGILDALECDVLVVKPGTFRCPVRRRPDLPLRRRAARERHAARV